MDGSSLPPAVAICNEYKSVTHCAHIPIQPTRLLSADTSPKTKAPSRREASLGAFGFQSGSVITDVHFVDVHRVVGQIVVSVQLEVDCDAPPVAWRGGVSITPVQRAGDSVQ